jgi:hypothetical protein
MDKIIIWNINDGAVFPIDTPKLAKFDIQVQDVPYKEWKKSPLDPTKMNLFFINLNVSSLAEIQKELFSFIESNPPVQLTLLGLPSENKEINSKHIEIIEKPFRKKELKLIIEKSIQAVYYKYSTMEIGSAILENFSHFEGLFNLASKETKDANDSVKAFELILDYEKKNKVSSKRIYEAMSKVDEMKETEMLQLFDLIKANEKLNALREAELKDALATKDATEKALEFSKIEEINMQKIINAHDRIFEYTDLEIRQLVEENKELKKKLGIQ